MPQSIIIGFVAENAHDALFDSSAGLGFYMEQHGYASEVINLYRPDCFDRFNELGRQHDIFFCYGYAGIGAHLKSGDQPLWDKLGIPFLSLLYDHPFYHPSHHRVESRFVCNAYAVRDFFEIQRDYIQSPQPLIPLKISSVGYASPFDPGWSDLSWDQRDIYGIYLKTGGSLREIKDSFAVMPPFHRSVMRDCLAAAQKDSCLDLAGLVRDSFHASGLDIRQDQKTWDDFVYITRVADQYLRIWRSDQMVEAIKHLPVLVIGGGWDHIDKTGAKARFMPAMQVLDAKDMLRRAKFVFNTHPYARHGWHERVFFGLELGSAVVTDRNLFTDEHFSDLPNFHGFDWGDPDRHGKMQTFLDRIEKESFGTEPAARRLAERFPSGCSVTQMIETASKMRSEMT